MTKTVPDFTHETQMLQLGATYVVGVDEAGRGPLAGPVTAAAVRLDPDRLPIGLNDSKLMTAKARDRMFDWLMANAMVSVAHASVQEIDQLNILRASHLAMERAVAALPADHALIDGNQRPKALACPSTMIVRGDAKCLSIAAASVIAKVTRDRIMVDLAQQHPQYGWDRNAGYPTKVHRQALLDFGVTPFHRQSFAPVHNILCQAISITP
jgi:ribonuclease HII